MGGCGGGSGRLLQKITFPVETKFEQIFFSSETLSRSTFGVDTREGGLSCENKTALGCLKAGGRSS